MAYAPTMGGRLHASIADLFAGQTLQSAIPFNLFHRLSYKKATVADERIQELLPRLLYPCSTMAVPPPFSMRVASSTISAHLVVNAAIGL